MKFTGAKVLLEILYWIHYVRGTLCFECIRMTHKTFDIVILAAIQKIKSPSMDEPAFRPDMRAVIDAPECARNTMKECWSEDPSERPTFSEIQKKLQPLKEGL